MTQLSDLGLLHATLTLLEEEHVSRAAQRLHLSVSATSRALDRSRATFNDPLLVRQGRNVVITPRGIELRDQIRPILNQLEVLLKPSVAFDPSKIRARFVIRANEAVISSGASAILKITQAAAPHARIQFAAEATDDIDALRNGEATLAIGSYARLPKDIAFEHLVDEQLVAMARASNPIFEQRITARSFAAADHVVVSRLGIAKGPLDDALATRNLTRSIETVVPSIAAAIAMATQSNLIAVVPSRLAKVFSGGTGLTIFAVPVKLPSVDIGQIWHHRFTDDLNHRWLRSCVVEASRTIEVAIK